jgi:hypothetical protein
MTPEHMKELVKIAARSGHDADIIEAAAVAMRRGIDPRSQKMIDLIRAAAPATDQRQIEAAAEFVHIREGHLQRYLEPDGCCLYCGNPADQCHPVGPISVKIKAPDADEIHEFCTWECFGQWAAEEAGGTFSDIDKI